MRFIRFAHPDGPRTGVLTSDTSYVDVTDLVPTLGAEALADGTLDRIAEHDLAMRAPAPVRDVDLLPPIDRPGKIVCVGLNYAKHAEESGALPPAEPILFMKDPACVVGPEADIRIPPGSAATDYEVELAIVIGRRALYLADETAARSVIAGYAISNDVSERDWQLNRGGQWDKGKSFPTFNPFGPWFATAHGVPDPGNLAISLRVNGELRQSSSTGDMIHGITKLVWYISQCMELSPGDIINTGTPEGVGMGSHPPRYLAAGDVIDAEIEGLGRQTCRITAT